MVFVRLELNCPPAETCPWNVYPLMTEDTSTKVGASPYRSRTMFSSVCSFHDSPMAEI